MQLRHQPGHVRRSHDDLPGLLAGQRTKCAGAAIRRSRRRCRRRDYRLGISQILTKNLLMGFSYETISDEGFFNNPYRQIRYFDPIEPAGLQLRARGLSAHAYERRGLAPAALLPAVARGSLRRIPHSTPTRGRSRRARTRSAIRIRSSPVGSSRASCGSIRRTRPISTATCSQARSTRTSWLAIRSSALSRANRCGSARPTTSSGRLAVRRTRHRERDLRSHPVRLR